MLEDRMRLQQRQKELANRHMEVCVDSLATASKGSSLAWASLSDFLNATVQNNDKLEKRHSTSAADEDAKDIIVMAAQYLQELLSSELLAEHPCEDGLQAARNLLIMGDWT